MYAIFACVRDNMLREEWEIKFLLGAALWCCGFGVEMSPSLLLPSHPTFLFLPPLLQGYIL